MPHHQSKTELDDRELLTPVRCVPVVSAAGVGRRPSVQLKGRMQHHQIDPWSADRAGGRGVRPSYQRGRGVETGLSRRRIRSLNVDGRTSATLVPEARSCQPNPLGLQSVGHFVEEVAATHRSVEPQRGECDVEFVGVDPLGEVRVAEHRGRRRRTEATDGRATRLRLMSAGSTAGAGAARGGGSLRSVGSHDRSRVGVIAPPARCRSCRRRVLGPGATP